MTNNKNISTVKELLLGTTLFKYVFLFFMFAISVPLVHRYTGTFAKLTLVWAVIIVLYDLFTTRKILRMRYAFLLIGLVLSYALTVLLNIKSNAYENIVSLSYTSVLLLVIFPDYVDKSREKIHSELFNFGMFYTVLTFVASLVSFIMFCMQYWKVDGPYRIGFYMGRLWGVYVSPNAGGIYALISIVLSAIFLVMLAKGNIKKYSLAIKIFAILNIICQIFYISLTDSKGTLITIIVLAMAFPFLFFMFNCERTKSFRLFSRLISCVVIAVMCAVVGFSTVSLSQGALSYLPSMIKIGSEAFHKNDSGEDLSSLTKEELEQIEIGRQYDDPELASGRVEMWKVGLKIIKEKPVFGVGQANIQKYAEKVYPNHKQITDKMRSGLHNVYLQVAVCCGIIGAGLFLAFFIMLLVKFLKFLIKGTDCRDKTVFIILGSLIISLMANNFGEATVFLSQSGITVVFWVILGYCVAIMDNFKAKNQFRAGEK